MISKHCTLEKVSERLGSKQETIEPNQKRNRVIHKKAKFPLAGKVKERL